MLYLSNNHPRIYIHRHPTYDTVMAVEQLRSWKHDIAERCTHITESIFDRYTDGDQALDATGITKIPNHVHRLRALVEYSLQDEVRAELLLSLLREINPYFYHDLVERGPQGKTGTIFLFVAITIVLNEHLVACILMSISSQNEN